MYRTDGEFRAENIPTTEGLKAATVRHPSDEEWARRQAARKLVYRIGRGRDTEPEVPNAAEADMELYEAIRTDGSPDLDGDEAGYLVNSLFWVECDADDIESGQPMRVPMDTPQGQTSHLLRMPSAKQIRLCRDRGRSVRSKGRKVEIQVDMKPSAELYDQLLEKAEGYEGAIPIDHKATAISAVFDFIEGLGRRRDPLA